MRPCDILVEVLNPNGDTMGLYTSPNRCWCGPALAHWQWDSLVRYVRRWRAAGRFGYHLLLINMDNRQLLLPYGERICPD